MSLWLSWRRSDVTVTNRWQGAYNSGKPGKLGEFKIYSGNLSDAVDCYMIVSLGHRVVCLIVSNKQ